MYTLGLPFPCCDASMLFLACDYDLLIVNFDMQALTDFYHNTVDTRMEVRLL